MKKLFAGVATFVAVLALCLVAACSTGIEGTYKFYSMSMNMGGVSAEIKVGEAYMGVTVNEDAYVMTINGDNTFELKANMGQEMTQKGTWEEKDGKYVLTADGESIEAQLDGKTLTFEMEGAKIVLKK